jgi:hypothetical protein
MDHRTLQQLAEKILADPAFRSSKDFKRIKEKSKLFADFLLHEAHGDALCAFGLLALLRQDAKIQAIPQFGNERDD